MANKKPIANYNGLLKELQGGDKLALADLEYNLQDGSIVYAADAGSTDAYAITLVPTPSAYTTGMVVHFKANTVNTGACTLNVNSLGAKTIKKNYDTDLADGDIKAGQFVSVIYDGTNFQLISPIANVASGGATIYVKPSDEVIIFTSTYQDDDYLVNIPLTANKNYLVEVILVYTTHTAAHFKAQLVVSGSATQALSKLISIASYNCLTFINNTSAEVTTSNSILGNNSARFEGIYFVGGSDITLKLQWAQYISEGVYTTLLKGSYIRVTEV